MLFGKQSYTLVNSSNLLRITGYRNFRVTIYFIAWKYPGFATAIHPLSRDVEVTKIKKKERHIMRVCYSNEVLAAEILQADDSYLLNHLHDT